MPPPASSPPPSHRHSRATECARLIDVSKRRGSWRSHVHRTSTAQRVQPFKPKACNASLSLGVSKGVFSSEREYPLCLAAAQSAALTMQRRWRCNPPPPRKGELKRDTLFRKRIPPLSVWCPFYGKKAKKTSNFNLSSPVFPAIFM